jgi:hypothetical protein
VARSARALILLCGLAAQLSAFNNDPWMEEFLSPESELRGQALIAERLNTDSHSHHQHNQAYEWSANFRLRFLPTVDATIGLNWVGTSHHVGYETAYVQGRYLLLDDLVGDPLSLTMGLQLDVPGAWTRAHRILLYHAPVEAQLQLALGKMFFTSGTWKSRIWGQANLGQGTEGAPFLITQLWWERQWLWAHRCGERWVNRSELGFVFDYLAGFGSHSMPLHGAFLATDILTTAPPRWGLAFAPPMM